MRRLTGRLKTDRWKDKQSGQDRQRVKVVAELVQFLGGGEHHGPHHASSSLARPEVAPSSEAIAAAPDEPPPAADDVPLPTPPPDLDELERIP